MSPNSISSGFGELFFFSSSESSDSESFCREDIKSSEISQQWEAIERTLYQEPGQQVIDPELLKECKLWRDTFPHIRVKGTKIDLKQPENELEEVDKSIQTVKNHFNLKKLEEKRESIKHKVVGMLVERLIAKYGPEKESANAEVDNYKSGVQITEIIDDDFSEKLEKLPDKASSRTAVVSTDRESYFERGKEQKTVLTARQVEKNLYNIFDSWERECTTATLKSDDLKRVENPMRGGSYSTGRIKSKKNIPFVKTFEMTKKIDKKYEGLLERILERKSNEMEMKRHCRTSASGLEMKNLQESLERLQVGSGFDDYSRRNTMPRINKFENTWLKRSEISISEDSFRFKKPRDNNNFKKLHLNKGNNLNERFLEDLRNKETLNYKKPAKGSGLIEEISFRSPKPLRLTVENSPKSLSCGDLQKKNKKEAKERQLKKGLEARKNESNLKKSGIKYNHMSKNKESKLNGTPNPLLPPIDTDEFVLIMQRKDQEAVMVVMIIYFPCLTVPTERFNAQQVDRVISAPAD